MDASSLKSTTNCGSPHREGGGINREEQDEEVISLF